MSKKQLGQFFTTNSDHILAGMSKFVRDKDITDPFAGAGDLIRWAREHGAKTVSGYDIDDSLIDNKTIFKNDTLISPKAYKFVITNPPYLNINKASSATKEKYFSNSSFEDLYQISLASIMDSDEGIFIVPINFLSAENSENIRRKFFSKFVIDHFNYFTYRVFADTTYNVIAAHYRKKRKSEESSLVAQANIFYQDAGNKYRPICLDEEYGWAIGREHIDPILKARNMGIYRLEEKHLKPGSHEVRVAWTHTKDIRNLRVSKDAAEMLKRNIILLKAIDSGSVNGQIALVDMRQHEISGLVSIPTSRHMIQLIMPDNVSLSEQEKLIGLFNGKFNDLRSQTLSLFLTNYRDKNRKRVGFDFVYKMLSYLYENEIDKKYNPPNTLELYV